MTEVYFSRPALLLAILLITATSWLPGCASQPDDNSHGKQPNILFCLADDWGWPHAGAYGDEVVRTPAFDRLAREGVLFEYAFVSSPSCTPSRNAVLTGQQFYRLGQGANLHSTLDYAFPNFMVLLRDAGYETGHWRKAWGPGNWQAGGYEEHPCGSPATFEDFMKERNPEKPFCFWFGTSDPHRDYEEGSGRKSGIEISRIHLPAFFPDVDTIRSDMADYYWEVQRWDREVAAAIQLLEEAGELDNTIIVMTGDNGIPFPRCKANLYDWGARAPLAIRWGDQVKPGRKLIDFVSFTDLAPTFLAAAGVPVPASMTGRSLLPLLTAKGEGRIDPARDFVVYGRERHTPAQQMPSIGGYPARALRTDRWLLILNQEPDRWPAGAPAGATHPMDVFADCDNGPTKSFLINNRNDARITPFYDLSFAKRPAVELYDCRADPDQVNNLAGRPEFAGTVDALRRQLTDYLRKTGDPRYLEQPVPFDGYPYRTDYLPQRLQEHGYRYLPEEGKVVAIDSISQQ